MALGFCFEFLCLVTDSINSGTKALVIMRTSLSSFHFVTEISLSDFEIISPFFNFFFITSTGMYFLSDLKVPMMYTPRKAMHFVSGNELYQLSVNKWWTYHNKALLNEEPQLPFAQGTGGLEIVDLSRFLFSIQSHRRYTVPKIWSHTCVFYFWWIDVFSTSHATTASIHLTIIPYEAWKFLEQYYLDSLWGTWSFLNCHLQWLALYQNLEIECWRGKNSLK